MSGPDLQAIRARWSRDGGMGNDRSDEDYTDPGCRVLLRVAWRDLDVLLDAVDRLTAERDAATERFALVEAYRDQVEPELADSAPVGATPTEPAIHALPAIAADGRRCRWVMCRKGALADSEFCAKHDAREFGPSTGAATEDGR